MSSRLRYQVYVEMGVHWSPMRRFNELSHVLHWVSQYDPDGTVAMIIKDNETGFFIPLDEVFEMVPTKNVVKDKHVEWKNEGF